MYGEILTFSFDFSLPISSFLPILLKFSRLSEALLDKFPLAIREYLSKFLLGVSLLDHHQNTITYAKLQEHRLKNPKSTHMYVLLNLYQVMKQVFMHFLF